MSVYGNTPPMDLQLSNREEWEAAVLSSDPRTKYRAVSRDLEVAERQVLLATLRIPSTLPTTGQPSTTSHPASEGKASLPSGRPPSAGVPSTLSTTGPLSANFHPASGAPSPPTDIHTTMTQEDELTTKDTKSTQITTKTTEDHDSTPRTSRNFEKDDFNELATSNTATKVNTKTTDGKVPISYSRPSQYGT
ncbi:uncharacterized protein LOC144126352 [Amblyomma americanum]